MTPREFRSLALAPPATEEREHMNHPDFRVAGTRNTKRARTGAWRNRAPKPLVD
ncbi:MAG TPA: hypothetical protein VKE96_09205 [Vicinamibacterales bacterium]|nr:hypothetical protein [Vicinamibacterales bacterium]